MKKKVLSKKLSVLNDYFGCKLNLSFYSDQIKLKLRDKLDELFENTYFVDDEKFNECFDVNLGVDKGQFFKLLFEDSECLIL